VEIKCQLDATEVFIADLIACSTCFRHHYAHHQELKSIIQWFLRVVFCAVVFSSSWSGVELRVMRPVCRMLGIVMPETCWASTKICNKNHCLHLLQHFLIVCSVCSSWTAVRTDMLSVVAIKLHWNQYFKMIHFWKIETLKEKCHFISGCS